MGSGEKDDMGIHVSDIEQSNESGDVEGQREGTFRTAELSTLGLAQATKRNLGPIDIICVGWNICNSWAGVAGTLALSIALGGSVTLIYGIVVCFVFVGCSGLTMAELVSVYPTAGGQYHWTSILAPPKASRVLSYVCGFTNVYAWIAGTCGVAIIISEGLLAMAIFYHSDYVPHVWHYFLVFQALNILCCIHNIFTLKRTLWLYDVAFFLTLTGFLVIVVTCLARATPKQSSEIVWTSFVNDSGWSSGITFLTGLISPNYMYAGIDGAIHLCEECKNAAQVVPRAIVSTLVIGFVTTFTFAVAMVYCIEDFDAVIATPTGFPIYEIWHQATRSGTAATVFMVVLLVAGVIALIAVQQTASRLTWSFARDNAILGSTYIGQVHRRLDVPVEALALNATAVFIIGCIFLGSSTAFNAFIGTGLILQQTTIAIPAALLVYRRRSPGVLPVNRPFRLPSPVGWAANVCAVSFAIVVVVFYNFPVVLPVTGSNMNYASAVIGAMIIFGLANWFIHARGSYRGPRMAEF